MNFSANAIEHGTDSSPRISRSQKASTICIPAFFPSSQLESLWKKVDSLGSSSRRLDSLILLIRLMWAALKLLETSWRDTTKALRSLFWFQTMDLQLRSIKLTLLSRSTRLRSITTRPQESKSWESSIRSTIISSTDFWHTYTETSPHICSIHYLTQSKKIIFCPFPL